MLRVKIGLASGLALTLATGTQAAPNERVEDGNLVMENIPNIPAEVTERLRQYQNVRGHGFSDWADTGILISTRFSEVNQVHYVNTPGGAHQQLTFYDEPVGGGDVSPAGGQFVFAKDTGGNEFYQGYLFDLATGSVTAFTEPGTRNGSLLWSDDGAQVAWFRSTAGDPNWDIWSPTPAIPAVFASRMKAKVHSS